MGGSPKEGRVILFTRLMGIRGYPFPLLLPGERIDYLPRGIMVDNGAYGYFLRGSFPPLRRWCAELLSAARRIPRSIPLRIIILPDHPLNGERTLEWLHSREVREIAEELRAQGWILLGVAHPIRDLNGFYESAARILEIDYVDGLAAPLKLPCRGRGRASSACQLQVAEQIAAAASEMGARWLHGLGSLLKRELIRKLRELGFSSIDSTSWTRPVTEDCRERCGQKRRRSARTIMERKCLLECALEYLGLSTPPQSPRGP